MAAYIQCAAIGFCAGIKPVLRGMDSQFNFALAQERCFAPEEGWTRHFVKALRCTRREMEITALL
jgi:hypothetical protein